MYMRLFAPDCGRPQVVTPDTTPPKLSAVSLSRTRFRVGKAATRIARGIRRGTELRFTSSEAARLRIVIQRVRVVRTRKHHKRTVYRRAGTLTRQIKTGRGSVKLSGRIGKRRMAAAHYRLTLTATDAAGNRSKPVRRTFTVLAG